MDKKIIKTGLGSGCNPKVMLVQHFLDDEKIRRFVIEKLKQYKKGGMPVPEELQEQLTKDFGIWIGSVTRLDDEALEKVYDELERDGIIKRWLGVQTAELKEYTEEALKWNQETAVDVTGFLVYAIVKNGRCRKRLMDYMEGHGEEYFGDYHSSAYCDSPLLGWFPQQEVLAAMLCIGLIERIRTEDGEKEAYEAFISIASGGYKWVRKYVKQSDQMDGKGFQRIIAEANSEVNPEGKGDTLYCLCAGVMGFVMSENVGTPIAINFLMLTLLTMLQPMSRDFLGPLKPVKITEEGTCRCREVMEKYHCSNSGWLAGGICYESMDFAGVLSIFGLTVRKLQEIVLTEKELQQLFSLCPEMKGEAVAPALMAMALCKYVSQLEQRHQPEEELKQLGKRNEPDAQREISRGQILEMKQELKQLRQEEMRLRQERDALAARVDELMQAVSRRREQMEQMKDRQEQARQEIKELQNFVCYLTEHPFEDEEDEKKDSHRCCRELNLERRRVVVVGGHENWQRRFREQFPMWQFLSADKNNFDAGCVRNKEIIILNTAVLKHSCYYRIMAERSEKQMVLYVHGNNLERCLDELEQQIEAG